MAGEIRELPKVSETAFPGDHHQRMKRIQRRQAGALIHHLLSKAAYAYQHAIWIVGTGTELWQKFAPLWTRGYGGAVLLRPSRIVGAYYRFAHDLRGQLYLIRCG